MEENKQVKRFGVYVIYDKDGRADNCVEYVLKDLRDNLDCLYIIHNGEMQESSLQMFAQYATKVIERPDEGYDATAWKEAFLQHADANFLSGYDEIVMVNDTFYGPFFPFRTVFQEMQDRPVDFWGLTKHEESCDGYGKSRLGYFPAHIQTYFMVIRKRMFESPWFLQFWRELPPIRDFEELVCSFELEFTQFFAAKGFAWDVYVNTEDLKTIREHNFNYYVYMQDDLLMKRNYPVIKRKNFTLPKSWYLVNSNANVMHKSLRHVREQTDYDEGLMWQNLLRNYNARTLYESLHLDYAVSEHVAKQERSEAKVAVFLHLYYRDLFDYCYEYAKSIPENADLYITINQEENRATVTEIFSSLKLNKLTVIVAENRGRELGALLVEGAQYIQKYDYICFLHDKKSRQYGVQTIGSDFCDALFENTLKSRAYVQNIIGLFDNEPYLGFLSTPAPYHGVFFACLGHEWTCGYENAHHLADKLGLQFNISPDQHPFTLGNAFWCRTAAIRPIFNHKWEYEDFPEEPMADDGTISHAIERCWAYIAQCAGYYSGVAMTTEYASLAVSNTQYMLRNIIQMTDCPAVRRDNFLVYAETLKSATQQPDRLITVDIGLKQALKNYLKKHLPTSMINFLKKVGGKGQ